MNKTEALVVGGKCVRTKCTHNDRNTGKSVKECTLLLVFTRKEVSTKIFEEKLQEQLPFGY